MCWVRSPQGVHPSANNCLLNRRVGKILKTPNLHFRSVHKKDFIHMWVQYFLDLRLMGSKKGPTVRLSSRGSNGTQTGQCSQELQGINLSFRCNLSKNWTPIASQPFVVRMLITRGTLRCSVESDAILFVGTGVLCNPTDIVNYLRRIGGPKGSSGLLVLCKVQQTPDLPYVH